MSSSGGSISAFIGSKWAVLAAAVALAGGAAAVPVVTGGSGGGGTCNATVSSSAALGTAITAATTGQTICLNTASYGTFTGTNKAITLKAAASATPTMIVDLTTGDCCFTLDGMTNMAGDIAGTANNITIKNSKFIDALVIQDVVNSGIVLDGNDHTRTPPISGDPALIHLAYGTGVNSGVTIENSFFHDTDADGVQSGVGVTILNNTFTRILENGPNHTDSIQLIDAPGSIVRGNWLYNNADGIVAYDGIDTALIENNAIDLVNGRWGIELYEDHNSVVRHNTLVPRSSCTSNGCGLVSVTHKTGRPASSGTQLYNNMITGVAADDPVVRSDHNINPTTAVYVGGSTPTTWAGYCLSGSSPVGRAAGDDGLDAGITC